MSDGSLSQDEIDALLQGSSDLGLGAVEQAPSGPEFPEADRQAFQQLVQGTIDAQSSNLSMLAGKTVTINPPVIDAHSRDTFLESQPDEIIDIKMDFTDGITGSHRYFLDLDSATTLAGLMMGQDGVELNDAAISALQEALSQIHGPVSTALGDKLNTTVMCAPPEGQQSPKAAASVPTEDFVAVEYNVTIEGANPVKLVELYGMDVVKQLVGGATDADGISMESLDALAGQAGPAQPAMQQNMSQGMGMQQPMMGVPQQQMGGMNQMGGMMQGMGQPMMNAQNVQQVQFPDLTQGPTASEQGNISLLMDVFMEMTVELGRTKKLIKDILGMGEGTIIELDKLAGEPVDILVNHKLIAKGEVVVIDENFGVRVTEIVSPMERMSDLT